MLVELVNLKRNKIVCTEGPFMLTAPALMNKTDVNIDCGQPPAALWLLACRRGSCSGDRASARAARVSKLIGNDHVFFRPINHLNTTPPGPAPQRRRPGSPN